MNTSYVYPSAQVGELRQALLYASGPASYSQSAGDPVYNPGSSEYINFPSDCTSLSGNYFVRFIPLAVGFNQIRAGGGVGGPSVSGWTARWFFTALGSGGVVAAVTGTGGSGMTAGTYALAFSGGGGSGAAGTITVGTGSITSITITNPGKGYTSAPTVTAATGGTPPTLTAVLATAGQEVAAGVVLTAEQIQFGAVVSSL